jgi:hypothetical protein
VSEGQPSHASDDGPELELTCRQVGDDVVVIAIAG